LTTTVSPAATVFGETVIVQVASTLQVPMVVDGPLITSNVSFLPKEPKLTLASTLDRVPLTLRVFGVTPPTVSDFVLVALCDQ